MTPDDDRFITLSIHTYERAITIKNILEREGVAVELHNVNLANPAISAGVRVRIKESDLPLALRIVENIEIFAIPANTPPPQQRGKILVPTDFSNHSMLAAKMAMQLAAKLRLDVEFLFAYIAIPNGSAIQLTNVYNYDDTDIETARRLQAEAGNMMNRFAASIRESIKSGEIPAARFTTKVNEGLPEEVILAYTREQKPPMVVMGTRGADKKGAEMIGSVTAEVLDGCRVPAFTVPENVSPNLLHEIENVAFFCNLDQEDILALDTLYRIFSEQHFHVTLIHIPPRRLRPAPISQTQENLLTYCCEHYTNYTFDVRSVRTHSVFDDLTAITNERRFHIFCLPNKRKNVFARVFNPSLAHKVLFQADIPMMVIPV
jgi:nucleotide-binding universal stress UspA family protein